MKFWKPNPDNTERDAKEAKVVQQVTNVIKRGLGVPVSTTGDEAAEEIRRGYAKRREG